MGRTPKPAAPRARSLPIFPTPAPADYSDEVSEKDLKALEALVEENENGEDGEVWELVDGPGW